MRLPRALTDPFQAIGCRIGRIGPVLLHAPRYREPEHRNRIRYTPTQWAHVNRCRYCDTPLTDRTGRTT